jgi:hypothetical protein
VPRRFPPSPRSSGRSRPAVLRSALHPEGYVELDGRLVRARWGGEGEAPSEPDSWVAVEEQDGRLWAFPVGREGRRAAGPLDRSNY